MWEMVHPVTPECPAAWHALGQFKGLPQGKPILTAQEAVKVGPLQSHLAHHMVSTVREQQVRAPLAFTRDKTDILAPGSPPRVVRSTFISMDSSILEATTFSAVSIR